MNLLFKALRDRTRRRILEMLKERDHTVGEIGDAFVIAFVAVFAVWAMAFSWHHFRSRHHADPTT